MHVEEVIKRVGNVASQRLGRPDPSGTTGRWDGEASTRGLNRAFAEAGKPIPTSCKATRFEQMIDPKPRTSPCHQRGCSVGTIFNENTRDAQTVWRHGFGTIKSPSNSPQTSPELPLQLEVQPVWPNAK